MELGITMKMQSYFDFLNAIQNQYHDQYVNLQYHANVPNQANSVSTRAHFTNPNED